MFFSFSIEYFPPPISRPCPFIYNQKSEVYERPDLVRRDVNVRILIIPM